MASSVELLDSMGSDLTVVNAARVSFDKQHSTFVEKDTGLIHYLARHGHISPFFHPQISLRVNAPIFVARQLMRHQVGLALSEVSRRYVSTPPAFIETLQWRKAAENVKQGSGGMLEAIDEAYANEVYGEFLDGVEDYYKDLLHLGVCAEQARAVLPLATMTQWIWTGSLYAFARVCDQRLDSHAQAECREVAMQIAEIAERLFPVSWKALRRYSPTRVLSKLERLRALGLAEVDEVLDDSD